MTPDDPSIESELRDLLPAALDEELLLRLESAAEGQLTELTHEELAFEEFLRKSSPAALSPDFISDLENTFRDVPFPVNEKILLFPKGNFAPRETSRKRPMWAAAAAVALIGAATALMVPISKPGGHLAGGTIAPKHAISDHLIPAGFNRGVSNVSAEGVVWKNETQPHNLMRVDYVDQITLKDEHGRTYQVEQPRVRYLLVPTKAD